MTTTAIRERQILFSGPMVRAILDGRKTQTRRVVRWNNPPPDGEDVRYEEPFALWRYDSALCPYGVPGDRLWVREAWAGDDLCGVVYRADHPNADLKRGDLDSGEQSIRAWKPSIHMPRWASRITLPIIDIRLERVREISEEDAKAEGADPMRLADLEEWMTYRRGFEYLWDSLNADRGYGWDANPRVWVIEFKRLKP